MSKIFKLDWKDLLKGAVVAILAALFYGLIQILPSLGLDPVVQAVISALLAYLSKNLATDEEGKFLGKV